MIKKLKFQIAFTVSLILSILLALILFTVNLLSYSASYTQAYDLLSIVAASYGETDNIREENIISGTSIYSNTRFFSVMFSPDGTVLNIKNPADSDISDDKLVKLCEDISNKNLVKGRYGKFIFTTRKFIGGKIVVVMDNSVNLHNIKTTRENSILIGFIGIVLIAWLSYALSDWLVYPVKQSLEKKKQFISDASHELKTPIAVIAANAEVIESELGENKWIGYIKSETERMSALVNNLLMLSRLDTSNEEPVFIKFNLSKTVEGVVMPFECVAFEKGIMLECNPGENIFFTGIEENLKQVVAILIDNAIKHTYQNGKISVTLKQHRMRVVLEVANTGDEIPKEERTKIFERFYRVDESRNRENGGYGLGLAIAKMIVDKHHGNIGVDCSGGWTRFKVVL